MLSVFAGIAVAFAPQLMLSRSRVQQSRASVMSCAPVAPAAINILTPISFSLVQGEDRVYAVNSSTSGYGSLGTAGLTVQQGTSGTLHYEIKMKGVDSRTVAKDDSTFVSTLSTEDKAKYSEVKTHYGGGLNIPMLSWIGINLGASVDKTEINSAASSNKDYNEQATAVKDTLNTHTETEIIVSGSLRATGVSFIPVTVTAFIKIAQVKMADGSTMSVVSGSSADVVAAGPDGKPVPTDDTGSLKILPVASSSASKSLTAQELSLPLPHAN